MILDIVGASASLDKKGLHVAFDVVPEIGHRLELKTGEIFVAPAKQGKENAISATLFVTGKERGANGTELPSAMSYRRWRDDSEIWLIWRLPDDQLAKFHSIILPRKTPRQAVVFFLEGPLFSPGPFEYGPDPEGRDQKWDNEKTPVVLIDNIEFGLIPKPPPAWDIEIPNDYDREVLSDTARVNFALIRKLSAIEASIRQLLWMICLIALLMVILLFRFWH